jgi:hypothetical protein
VPACSTPTTSGAMQKTCPTMTAAGASDAHTTTNAPLPMGSPVPGKTAPRKMLLRATVDPRRAPSYRPPSSESDDGKPGHSQSRRRKGGKKNDAEVDGAEEGHMSKETRIANNVKHRTLRMKTPKYTCSFIPGCNDTFNRSKLQEGGRSGVCLLQSHRPGHLRTCRLQLSHRRSHQPGTA